MDFNCNKRTLRPKADRERVFIAAPFFNPQQMGHVIRMEEIIGLAGHEFWSARLQHKTGDGPTPKITTRAQAEPVYKANMDALLWSSVIIACTDWMLPKNQNVYAINDAVGEPRPPDMMRLDKNGHPITSFERGNYPPKVGCPIMGTVAAGPLNIPDTGVAFEMGAIAMLNMVAGMTGAAMWDDKALVMFTLDPKRTINLMLSVPVDGVITSWGQLEGFVNAHGWEEMRSHLTKWEGGGQ